MTTSLNTYIFVDNPRLMFIRAMKILNPIGKSPYVYDVNTEFIEVAPDDPDRVVKLGKNVKIWPGCVIGVDGFGFERNEKGELEKFPHIRGVVIGDNVEIQANTCIDRGNLDDTIIGEGTKIDNLVHIAHNCKIGKHCSIASLAGISGGTTIGDYCHIGTGATIRDGITIGNNVLIGIGAIVTKDISDNITVAGNPARDIEAIKRESNMKKMGLE